jgi:hypothetical protein
MYLYATNYGGDLYSLWPGDSRIINYYSSDAQGRWSNLQNRILAHIDNPSAPWIGVKNALNQFQINTSRIDDQIIASLIRAQIHTQSQPWWCRWAGAMQTFFSYSYGAANFLLYASFPVLLLIIIIFRRLSLFLQYAEFLIWIKSWILTAAFSHYISLIAARVQAQATPSTMNWFWDYPYYTLLASILLYVLPALTFIGIYRSFQFINNTSLLAGRQGGQND